MYYEAFVSPEYIDDDIFNHLDVIFDLPKYKITAFNVYGKMLERVEKLHLAVPINLNINFPRSINDIEVELEMLKKYVKKYPFIHTINYSLSTYLYELENREVVKENLSLIGRFGAEYKKPIRLVIPYYFMSSNSVLHDILDIAGQCNISGVLLWNEFDLNEDLEHKTNDLSDFLIDAATTAKQIDLPVGIILDTADDTNLPLLENANGKFKAILLDPVNILETIE